MGRSKQFRRNYLKKGGFLNTRGDSARDQPGDPVQPQCNDEDLARPEKGWPVSDTGRARGAVALPDRTYQLAGGLHHRYITTNREAIYPAVERQSGQILRRPELFI